MGGGAQNAAQGDGSTAAGGLANKATGFADTVAGGQNNLAESDQATSSCYNEQTCGATVSGGLQNVAKGSASTISGGYNNLASGAYASIPGGGGNQALGDLSFAGGDFAVANYERSFVWNDGSYDPRTILFTQDTAPHQFVASAAGGFFFYDASDLSTGVTLPTGSGSWNSLSDRNVKENFSDVDGKALLAKLAAVPILTWNYKAQAKSIRHMGPTAQDFREAFDLGEDEKHISTVDAQGVALAGIQALYKISQEKDAKIAALEEQLQRVKQEKDAEIAELSHKLDAKLHSVNLLEERLSRLEGSLERTLSSSSGTKPQVALSKTSSAQGQ